MIVDALNCDDDALRLHFGAKALRKVLTANDSPAMMVQVTKTYSRQLGRRLVHLLEFQTMNEMVTEILWVVVNLLSVKSDAFALHFV